MAEEDVIDGGHVVRCAKDRERKMRVAGECRNVRVDGNVVYVDGNELQTSG